jgi:pyrroline-5-carboxylate reductase
MFFQNIGFIGCGNMGSALARAIQKEDRAIFLSNRSSAKAEALAQEIGGIPSTNQEIAADCDLIFLGVKPQMMASVLQGISRTLKERIAPFVLVSMAAGLSTETIQNMAGLPCPVLRIMPNTPASIGAGMILCCQSGVTPEELEEFQELMQDAGRLDQLGEGLIDAGSAVSGCGPAFVYLFIEALADGGVACGLPRDKALTYAAQTVLGSAELVLQSDKHPGALKDAVCSPAGTTIQGVRALEQNGFRSAAMEAVIAAYEKTLSLS